MSQILIIHNALDSHESQKIESDNALKTFLEIRAKHPQARIYKGNPSLDSDITPNASDRQSIASLLETNEDSTIVCYPGEFASTVTWIASKLFGQVVMAFVKMPKLNNNSSQTGSSNNSLSNPENKQRIGERPPYILGRVKAVPDLIANPIRYFKDGIEVEELLLQVSENKVVISKVKEGDTPVQEITGKSVTVYDHNQSIIGSESIFKWGDTFDEAPTLGKQNASVNGQTLLSPNTTRSENTDIYFQYPNLIKCLQSSTVDDFEDFNVNETIIIEGANFGVADLAITGSVQIDNVVETLTITSSQTASEFENYRKINITAMLITDPVNGQLDLAGLYDIGSIVYSSGSYIVKLLNPTNTNTNFANLTQVATTNISANLTANTSNIYLDGAYTVTGIDRANKQMSLASPNTVNLDWDKLQDLTGQQTPAARIKLRGSQNNYIGWFTTESPLATGLLVNFRAGNGIYRGSSRRSVTVEVEYQQVVSGTPTGAIYTKSITLMGRGGNRDAVGGSMWIDLPFSGAVRFRARRTNDNGDHADLVDETKFYSAYAYHKLQKLVYSDAVIMRARTVATQNATSQDSRQLNCIAESLVYSYRDGIKSSDRILSRNIADLTIDLALHPKIGRRSESEIDFERIYQVVGDIVEYFGSEKMSEFNYTLDNDNTSFEELMRMMSVVTCTHDRRIARNIYYDLERADNDPIILFNHRNKRPNSETRVVKPQVDSSYDGIELSYIDSENGWIEKTLKIPNEFINNPKKVDVKGIVYKDQAHIVAWREWNKLLFTRVTAQFTAYCESDLIFQGDCILNTNDVRMGNTSSGQVDAWDGLSIKVSQPFVFDQAKQYWIHLQLISGFIDVIQVTQGDDAYHFLLERPPSEPLIITGQVHTMYTLTISGEKTDQRFLVSTRTPKDIFENEVVAVNFDERFYRNDKDIINHLI